MQPEQPPQLALAHAQSFRQAFDSRLVQRTRLDQPARRATVLELPCQTANSGEVSGRQRKQAEIRPPCAAAAVGKESHVLPFGRWRGTERPAVDTGRGNRDEEPAIETTVPGLDRAVTGVVVHVHAEMIPRAGARVSRFSDVIG